MSQAISRLGGSLALPELRKTIETNLVKWALPTFHQTRFGQGIRRWAVPTLPMLNDFPTASTT